MSQPAALADHLGFWLRFVSNHVSQAFQLKLESQGVTVAEWVLLRELLSLHDTPPSQLAEQLGMTRGAISKLVERLCAKKLVKRVESSSDRRFQAISLTAAGRKLVPVLARVADDNEREFFGHLSPAQYSECCDLLRDLVRRHQWKDVPVA